MFANPNLPESLDMPSLRVIHIAFLLAVVIALAMLSLNELNHSDAPSEFKIEMPDIEVPKVNNEMPVRQHY